ncbi:MAG: hypothetical protein ACYCSG_05075 [Thermoplasmataceae archaeon]
MPVNTAAAVRGGERPILRKEFIGKTSPSHGDKGKEPNKQAADKRYSIGNPL